MPIRSFMESDLAGTVLAGKRFAAIVVCHRYWKNNLATVKALGIKHGGKFVNGIHFIAAGGPIGSMLALMSYFGTGDGRLGATACERSSWTSRRSYGAECTIQSRNKGNG
jgi:hypothetical protein